MMSSGDMRLADAVLEPSVEEPLKWRHSMAIAAGIATPRGRPAPLSPGSSVESETHLPVAARNDWLRGLSWSLARTVLSFVCLWYASSITIIFANKLVLNGLNFRYPFFLTAAANTIASFKIIILTRTRRFRRPLLPLRVFTRDQYPH